MTGCRLCDAGPVDDCTDDCLSRQPGPPEVARLVAKVAERLPETARARLSTARTPRGGYILASSEVELWVDRDQTSDWDARIVSDTGLVLCRARVESPHWLQAAVVVSAMANEFLY